MIVVKSWNFRVVCYTVVDNSHKGETNGEGLFICLLACIYDGRDLRMIILKETTIFRGPCPKNYYLREVGGPSHGRQGWELVQVVKG